MASGLAVGLKKQSLGASPPWIGFHFSSLFWLTAQVGPEGNLGRVRLVVTWDHDLFLRPGNRVCPVLPDLCVSPFL